MEEQKYELLVMENLGLVHMCANRFRDKGLEYDDLFSAGCIGLCGAARRFDEERGTSFSTFAVPAILGEIKRLFRDGGNVKISRQMKEKARELRLVCEEIEEENGSNVKMQQIAEKMNLTVEEVAEILGATKAPVNVDSAIIKEESFESHSCTKVTINAILKLLSPLDRKIIELRYLCDLTQSETGKVLGISQVRVSRSEKNSLSVLRSILLADPYFN